MTTTSEPNATDEHRVGADQTTQPAGTVRSVARALRALELVASRPDGVTARELAAHLDLALPSTYHLLATLADAGYLVHLADEHRYGLGYAVRVLETGLSRQLGVADDVCAAIRRVHIDADAAAYYAVYRGEDVVVAHVVDSPRRPRVQVLDVGFHEASHATAFGKVMLAAMTEQRRTEHLARQGMVRCTARTLVQEPRLEAHLAHVRESGVALEVGEFQENLSCLAAPVHSAERLVVGAVAISLPSPDFARRRWQLERVVRQGALRVTRARRREAS